jgi:phage shock protein A
MRSRMRKLEESQESEGRVAALQELLTLANDHLETMKGCLMREEARCSHLRQTVRFSAFLLRMPLLVPLMC